MVTRGPFEHPGANAVEDENGRLVNLTHMPLQAIPIAHSIFADSLTLYTICKSARVG